MGQDEKGIRVIDQWLKKAPTERYIYISPPKGGLIAHADAYSVILQK